MVNDTVFIMFGIDRNANVASDLLILDVRNVNSISFSSKYPLLDSTNSNDSSSSSSNGSPDNKDSSDSNDDISKHLSTGAIVGIAVGCSILVGDYATQEEL